MTILSLVLSFIAGMGLGLIYFGGLWLTLKHLPHYKRPILMTMASFLVRTAVVLLGFYLLVKGNHLDRLLVAVVGFIIMRIIVVRPKIPKAPKSENT